mgnify:CR=1 FL=1
MKLHLIHNGDSSVGDIGESFDIDCPFEKDTFGQDNTEALEYFKRDMIDLYSEYVDYRLHGLYDFELKNLD